MKIALVLDIIYLSYSQLKDLGISNLIVNSLHFMKKLIHHETTKVRKHEICFLSFSYFRAFVINFSFGSGFAGLGI
jgi:hypothetical protein